MDPYRTFRVRGCCRAIHGNGMDAVFERLRVKPLTDECDEHQESDGTHVYDVPKSMPLKGFPWC